MGSIHEGSRGLGWLVLPVCLLTAAFVSQCGDDDAEPIDTGGQADVVDEVAVDDADDTSVDDTQDTPDMAVDLPGEPPSFHTIVVSVTGELPSEDDFTDADAIRIIPTTLTAEFRVRSQDDSTAIEDLIAEVIDGGAESYDVVEQTPTYRNGLWFIETDVSPDSEMRIRLEDTDGHVSISTYAFILPPRNEAVVGDWEQPFFDTEQVIIHQTDLTLDDEGAWDEVHGETGAERGGTYDFADNGDIELEERYRARSDDNDTNRDTIEWVYVGPYYIDELYLALSPFTRADDLSDRVGTWTRQLLTYQPDGDGELELVEDRTETLVLNDDDTWTETWTGTQYDGEEETTIDRSWSGTWAIEINLNYTESVGDFLARTVTAVDGAAVTEPYDVWYQLHLTRVGHLLISPNVRVSN